MAQHTYCLAGPFHEEAYGLRPVSSVEAVLRGGLFCLSVCQSVASDQAQQSRAAHNNRNARLHDPDQALAFGCVINW